MTAAKAELQGKLRKHVRDHGVIAGWRLNEYVGTLPDVYGPDVVLGWVLEVLQATGTIGKNTTLWIEKQLEPAEVRR